MATATHPTARKRAPAKASAPRRRNATALLKADHREVERLFSQFNRAKNDEQKAELARQICLALRVHAQIEEEIFYPTSREFLDDEAIVDEALVEHVSAKALIGEIERMRPGEAFYDAKVKMLAEHIRHHVKEEEKEYFPEIQKSDMDLKSIGEELAERKAELMAEINPAWTIRH